MAWRPHGRARVSSRAPEAAGICDRCGLLFSLSDLTWQFQWAGPQLQNLRLLVCRECNDVPQPQLKPRILPPDPMPRLNARPQDWLEADYDLRVTEVDENIRVDEDAVPRVVENIANNRLTPEEEP